MSEFLRRLALSLYESYLHDGGRKVNYEKLKASDEFKKYKKLVSQLVRVQIENASREAKIAFFVNVYNALAIHGLIERGPPRNMWQRYLVSTSYITGTETIRSYECVHVHAT